MTDLLVTTTADVGAGSLRQAVIAANSDTSGPHTIAFDTAGVFASPQTISLLTALPTITESVTIIGTGATNLTIQRDPGAGDFRIFHLEDAALLPISVTISKVTLTGGHEVDGGAILSAGETLALDSVVINGNTASDDGGGIYFSGENGSTLSITNSTISGNTAADGGGGISALAVTLTGSTISGNSAGSFGGGMSVGTATLTNSTVSSNTANVGGGVEALTANLANSTVSGNSATFQGGGIFATTANLTNSIVLGNNALATDEVSATTANYNGLNIIGVGADTNTSDGVINASSAGTVFAATVDIDPGPGTALAGVLADNGGPVQTIALKRDASNPAIDAGDDTPATATDARGLARIDFGADGSADLSDLGAFEAGGLDSLIVTTLSDGVDAFDGLVSLREAITYANSHADADTITFDASLAEGTITLSADLPAVGSDMVIDGGTNDITVSGGGLFRGFFIGAWEPGTATQIPISVTIQNLTIANAVAQGGSAAGTSTGAGGAGLGGAIFVANGANVSLSGVALVGNQALGGDGGDGTGSSGGGGGMGGDANVGGGGLGRGATGSPGSSGSGQPGIATGAAPGGSGDSPNVGGADGGGGAADGGLGGGGGVGGHNSLTATDPGNAAGGFGGGGGADGGAGGFGGGGGGGGNFGDGGDGGFAGGGGGGTEEPLSAGNGGFGGGDGSILGGGGGGGGLGGAIFVQEGGELTLLGPLYINSGTVAGGSGGGAAGDGAAFGSGLFLQGDGGTITFSPGTGQLQLVTDVLADQAGSGGAGSYGLAKTSLGTLILAGSNSYTGLTTVEAGVLRVDGSIVAATTVKNGGALGGNGTTAAVSVEAGGALRPGASAGILTTGALDLAAGANFEVEFGGTTPGVGGYDQVIVNGTVNLGGANLLGTFLGSFVPTPGDQFTIIDNDGGDPVVGIFAGIVEGATFDFGQDALIISYAGGDGNDVVLTAIAVSDPPAGTDKTISTDEDVAYVFTVADFGFGDPVDSPADELAAVRISSLPAAGLLLYDGVAITAAEVTAGFEVSAADIAAGLLSFAPAADGNGTGYASFTFQVRDDGGTVDGGVDTDQSPNTITIDVVAVDDPLPSGVTIVGTKGADLVDATHTVAGEPLPTAFDDVIKGKGGKDDLSGLSGDDTIGGGKSGDILRGDAGNDTIRGKKGHDKLKGGDGDDDLRGDKGKDKLKGEAGNDRIDGRQGKDTLTGGQGDDTFAFAHPDQKDEVTDFAEGDIIALAKGAFSGIGPKGALGGKFFHVGDQAETTKQKILYDDDSGWLLYAKHGSETADPVRFAKIGKNLDHFDSGDIIVV